MNYLTITCFLLLLIASPSDAGPVTAHSLCVSCCAAAHSADWLIPLVGATTTGMCIVESCLSVLPISLPLDPRDTVCMTTFLAAMLLPTP